MSNDNAKFDLQRLRLRNVASRIMQFTGFYLMFASAFVIFAPLIGLIGFPVGSVPELLLAPIMVLEISPVISAVAGFVIVWLSTSSWFMMS